jgi:hypothetical protein
MEPSMNSLLTNCKKNLVIYKFPAKQTAAEKQIELTVKELGNYGRFASIEAKGTQVTLSDNSVIILIVGSRLDFDVLLEQSFPGDCIKIVAYFLTANDFSVCADPDFRRPFKARSFHLIYPDRANDEGLYFPSCAKIIDTIYFKTVRSKFNARCSSINFKDNNRNTIRCAISKIREIGLYLKEKGVNISDSFAGAIAVRLQDSFIINAANTDKHHIADERICYIESYSAKSNQVDYIGQFAPSSETLAAYLAFKSFPSINLFIHFHHKPITYGERFNKYRTAWYVPYGTQEEAEVLVDTFKETGNFAIAYGHGEFILAYDFQEVKNILVNILDSH